MNDRYSPFAALRRPFALVLLLCALLFASVSAPAQTLKRQGRAALSLDGEWQFRTDPGQRGEAEKWTADIPKSTQPMPVPSLWRSGPAPGYAGVAWMWRRFDIPAAWKGQTLRLRFGAAGETARIWVNGASVGAHSGGVISFDLDVTKAAKFGETNLVAVRLEGDARTEGGLWQSVALLSHDEAYLGNIGVRADGRGNLEAAIELINKSQTSGASTLDAKIFAPGELKKEARKTLQNLHISPGENVTTLLTGLHGAPLRRWSPNDPVLYRLQLAFRQEKDILDSDTISFGFREFGGRGDQWTLNGLPLHIAPTPQTSVSLSETLRADPGKVRETLQAVKASGANLIYLDAPAPTVLQIADEIGLLVIVGARPRLVGDAYAEELKALLQRDRSHPCILGWNLRTLGANVAVALRELDPTRFLLSANDGAAYFSPPGRPASETLPLPWKSPY